MDRRLVVTVMLTIGSVALLVYQGTSGAFWPLAGARIESVSQAGRINTENLRLVPAFYVLGSIISQITEVPAQQVMSLPVQLAPLLVTLYVVFREISRNHLITIFIVCIVVFSQSVGARIFYYQHGLASIFLYLTIFLVIRHLQEPDSRYLRPLYVLLTAVVFISYNHTLRIGLILVLTSATLVVLRYFPAIVSATGSWWRVAKVSAFLGVILIGLSEWFYWTFIPQALAGEAGLSATDIFTGTDDNQLPIDSVLIQTRPDIIFQLGAIKYLILGFALVISGIVFLKHLLKDKKIEPREIILFSTLITAVSYFIARFAIGQVSYAALFLPCILAIAILYRDIVDIGVPFGRSMVVSLAIASLMITGIILGAHIGYNTVERELNGYEYTQPGIEWHDKYSQTRFVSDVRTRHLYIAHISGKKPSTSVSNIESKRTRRISVYTDLPVLLGNSTKTSVDTQYALNMRLNSVPVAGWVELRPWEKIVDRIDSEPTTRVIYTSGDIRIYSPLNIED